MKKFLLLLGFYAMIVVLSIPQAQADEIDIGYQVTLSEDHDAVVSTVDFPAVNTAPEFVVQVIDRSPGVRCEELRSIMISELEAKSPAELNGALLNGDVTINDFFDRQSTRLKYTTTGYNVTQSVFSTSNGGSSY